MAETLTGAAAAAFDLRLGRICFAPDLAALLLRHAPAGPPAAALAAALADYHAKVRAAWAAEDAAKAAHKLGAFTSYREWADATDRRNRAVYLAYRAARVPADAALRRLGDVLDAAGAAWGVTLRPGRYGDTGWTDVSIGGALVGSV